MKKVVGILLFFILFFSTSLGYTLTVNDFARTGVVQNKLITLIAPIRAGYTFSNWEVVSGNVTLTDSTAMYTTFKMPANNVIIKSNYIKNLPSYSIVYSANGGSGAPANQYKTEGETIIISSNIPTRTGYSFLGWNTVANATSPQYVGGDSFTTDANTTLYAVWLDSTAPVISNLTNTSNGNWCTTLTLEWDIEELGSGIDKVQWSLNSDDFLTSTGNFEVSEWYSITRNQTRNDIIYIRAIDKAGNISDVVSTPMKIDRVMANIDSNKVNARYTKDNEVTITANITDEHSGVEYVRIDAWYGDETLGEFSYHQEDITFDTNTGDMQGTIAISEIPNTSNNALNNGDGNYYFNIYVRDNAGTVVVSPAMICSYDTTPPSGTVSLSSISAEDLTVKVTADITDTYSGVEHVEVRCWTGGNSYVSNAKTYVLPYVSTDNNYSTTAVFSEIPDTTSGDVNQNGGTYWFSVYAYDNLGNYTNIDTVSYGQAHIHTGGTHENGGICTSCNNVYQIHGVDDAWVSDGTNHWNPCTFTDCVGIHNEATHTGGTATCTAAAICSVCNASYGTELGHMILDEYVTDGEQHWKECKRGCGTIVVEKENHIGGTATCTTLKVCSVCNASYGTVLGHITPAEYTTDGDYHWKVCERGCLTIVEEKQLHTGGTATCQDQAICSVCNLSYGGTSSHIASSEYTTDGINHWKVCKYGCGTIVGEKEVHIGGTATCLAKAICGSCGISYGSFGGHAVPLTYVSNETEHWKVCENGCGEIIEEAVEHSGGNATCTDSPKCSLCGTSYGESLGHTIPNIYVSDADQHWKVCGRGCGEIVVEKEGHSGGTATCLAKATCSTCKAAYGDILEHTIPEAYTSDEFNHWKVCGRGCGTIVVEKEGHSGGSATCQIQAECDICKKNYGDKAEHSFIITTECSYINKCNWCEETEGTHVESTSYLTDANQHWKVCGGNCGTVILEKTDHFGGTPTYTSGANCTACNVAYGNRLAEPVLGEGMTPVNWDSVNNMWVSTNVNDWEYDYNSVAEDTHELIEGNGNGKWANAMTEDGSMYVWIPRYTYKVTSGVHSAGYSWNNETQPEGQNKILVKISNGIIDDTSDSYIIHPAFNFGDTKLRGIWVAKFEASRNDADEINMGTGTTPTSKPSVRAWTNTTLSDMFNYAYNLDSTVDSHLMKNTEWGAVAYLTNAIGKIPYPNNSIGYVTGKSASSDEFIGVETPNDWNTADGVKASTTHNIYGIYDMAGGVWEVTSAYIKDSIDSNITNLLSAASKYKDVYPAATSASAKYAAWNDIKGDAIYETSTTYNGQAWDEDIAFIKSTDIVFKRGGEGAGELGNQTGIFAFYSDLGNAEYSKGFRVVLTGISR